MKVGISINGVLRDYFGKIEKTHTKYFNPEDLQEVKIRDYNLEEWIQFPEEVVVRNEIEFNPDFNEREFLVNETSSQEIEEVMDEPMTVEEFIYDKCCLEIFGYADESIDGAVNSINDLTLQTIGKHEFIVVSREAGRSVPATLFFLSKTGCMITDHPDILNTKPEGKLTIKIEKPFNQEIPSDYTIKTVKELSGIDIFN